MDPLQQLNRFKKRLPMLAILISAICQQEALASTANESKNLPPSEYISLFKQSMTNILENTEAGEKEISQYMSPNYIQITDGKRVDYRGFVQHIAVQKKLIVSARVRFVQIIAQDNVVSTNHEVDVVKKDGTQCTIKVIGHITYEGDKVVATDEMSMVTQGNPGDKELASIS
jgi:hypothetical protein